MEEIIIGLKGATRHVQMFVETTLDHLAGSLFNLDLMRFRSIGLKPRRISTLLSWEKAGSQSIM